MKSFSFLLAFLFFASGTCYGNFEDNKNPDNLKIDCSNGDTEACKNLFTMHSHGIGVKKSQYDADKYYFLVKIYESEDRNIFTAYEDNVDKEIKNNYYFSTFELFDVISKICKRHPSAFCYYKLGDFYNNGIGVQQNKKKSYENYKKAFEISKKKCFSGYGYSCLDTAKMYMNGFAVKKSKSEAKKYFSKACALRNQEGCTEHANID